MTGSTLKSSLVWLAAAVMLAGCGGSGAGIASRPAGATSTRSDSPTTQSLPSAAAVNAPHGAAGIATPGFPAMIVAASGSIWVFPHRAFLVYRVNPATNRIVAEVNVHDTPCTLAAAGAGLVWLSNCGPGENSTGWVFGIDATTNRVVRRIRGGFPAFGDGSLWVLDDSGKRVRRVDPRSGVVLANIPTGSDQQPGGGTLALAGIAYGSAWLASDASRTVTRISTVTNKVTAVIPLAGAKTQDEAFPNAGGYIDGAQMAFEGGKAWYGNPAGLFEIDPQTNNAKLIPLRMQPFTEWGDIPIVSGAGSVWLRTSDTRLDRIDPATGRVLATYPADSGGGGGGLAVAFGSLWVDNAGSDSVWREPIKRG